MNQDDHPKTVRNLLAALRVAFQDPAFRQEFMSLIADHHDALLVEPMYSCQVAQRLIPMSEGNLAYWMTKLNIPKRYRVFRVKRNNTTLPQRMRMLSASEVHLIRSSSTRIKTRRESHAEQVLTTIIPQKTSRSN